MYNVGSSVADFLAMSGQREILPPVSQLQLWATGQTDVGPTTEGETLASLIVFASLFEFELKVCVFRKKERCFFDILNYS